MGRLAGVCFVPPRAFAATLTFTSRGLLSVTGEGGHGGGRYSQLLRVVSSSSKRRLVEPLLLGCGLVSRSGLRGGRPLSPATRTRPVLLGIPLLALRRRARLGRRGGVRPRDYLEPPDCERGRRPLLSVLLPLLRVQVARNEHLRALRKLLGCTLGGVLPHGALDEERLVVDPLLRQLVVLRLIESEADGSDGLTGLGVSKLGVGDDSCDLGDGGQCH